MDGRNGQVLWSFDKSRHEVFALNCQRDIDGDNIPDCLTGGRGGVSIVVWVSFFVTENLLLYVE